MHKDQNIQNFPEDVQGVPRRRFISQLIGGTAAAAVLPAALLSEKRAEMTEIGRLSSTTKRFEIDEARFWRLVKKQFLIREDLIMLNAANLCPSPYPVQQQVFDLTRDVDRDCSSINRAKFSKLQEKARAGLAAFLGADADEIAIVRNTSEGNNIVIGGLTFKTGDEVVIWDENHPTANVAWDVRAQRYGFKVKRVKAPEKFSNFEDLARPFLEAINDRTRLLSFSHVSNISGIALPVKDICKKARAKGVLTHVDGAQTFGSQVVDLHDLSCDFYTGSAHKWFCGPKEVGVLYVRKEKIEDLWPSIVGVGYPNAAKRGATKFETLGQRDDARVSAMGTTVDFHNTIGKTRIEARIKFMASFLKGKLKQQIPNIQFRTPLEPEMSGGVVIFSAPELDLDSVLNTLYHEHNIGCAVFGGISGGVRFCPHIYNTLDEIDRAASAVASLI